VKTKDKVSIGGGIFFAVMLIGVGIYEKKVCNPEWKTIEENLEHIRKANTVKKIELYQAYDYPNTNLTRDTVEILDTCDIESIQEMINNRYQGHWNRPTHAWTVTMKLTLDNANTMELKIAKITNDNIPNLTHLYFGSLHCQDHFPSCSETLGDYLEQLTAYGGTNF